MPEAERLFEELVKNRVIDINTTYKDGKVQWGKSCSLGSTLYFHWSDISKYDMNIGRWIVAHPEKTTVKLQKTE